MKLKCIINLNRADEEEPESLARKEHTRVSTKRARVSVAGVGGFAAS